MKPLNGTFSSGATTGTRFGLGVAARIASLGRSGRRAAEKNELARRAAEHTGLRIELRCGLGIFNGYHGPAPRKEARETETHQMGAKHEREESHV